jgi:putative transposase
MFILKACQQLYNAGLEQRRDAYRKQKKAINVYDQHKELTQLRHDNEDFRKVSAVVLQQTLIRLDRSFKAFFRRIKAGQTPGYPRFRSLDRYDSFEFSVPRISGNTIIVPKLGSVKFKKYRPLQGIPKHAQVMRTSKGWAVSIVCDLGEAPTKVSQIKNSIGIDVGLTDFATLSNADVIENPRFYHKSEDVLAKRQQALSRKKKGSNSRKRAKLLVVKAHEKIRNQRLDFVRKLAKALVTKYDFVAYEKLNIKGMAQSRFSKSIYDAAWGKFTQCLISKAEEAGKYAIAVDPKGTTQRCSQCQKVTKKTLDMREHICSFCGLRMHRDLNAAINIHALGWSAMRELLQKSA